MESQSRTTTGKDPCLPIQADLSAMLDGELDAASVRRVMVHSDVCGSCSAFLRGIRDQVQSHRQLIGAGMFDGVPLPVGVNSQQAETLRQRLLENRFQLARILYELGRGFVLMTVSPNYSRVVAREPVPVPDMCLRWRNLLDEVQRFSTSKQVHIGEEWVRAKVLFDNQGPSYLKDSLAKGKRLLREALMLREDYHEARIYLGQAYQVEEDRKRAMREYGRVLGDCREAKMRAFALENLGNVHLEEGEHGRAIPYFLELVDSGIIPKEPRFFTTYFNLALAYGNLSDFAKCEKWLGRLHDEFPHRRRMIARELKNRSQFARVIRRNAEVEGSLARKFPCWFQERV